MTKFYCTTCHNLKPSMVDDGDLISYCKIHFCQNLIITPHNTSQLGHVLHHVPFKTSDQNSLVFLNYYFWKFSYVAMW